MEKLVGTSVGLIAPLAYLGSFIGGIPLIWLLHKVGRLRLGHAVLGAGAIGAIEGAAILMTFRGPDNSTISAGEWSLMIPSILLAMLVAVVFCMIAGVRVRSAA